MIHQVKKFTIDSDYEKNEKVEIYTVIILKLLHLNSLLGQAL